MNGANARERDLLGDDCILCGDAPLQQFFEDEVLCRSCFAVFPRWLTKAQVAAIQAQQGVQK